MMQATRMQYGFDNGSKTLEGGGLAGLALQKRRPALAGISL